MIIKRNWIKLCSVFIVTIIISVLFVRFSLIDIGKILEEDNDFQYNAISTSATIGGFLFTGVSILISTIDKDRIKRLWDNNYLDNLYRSAFIGMMSNVTTIVSVVYMRWL